MDRHGVKIWLVCVLHTSSEHIGKVWRTWNVSVPLQRKLTPATARAAAEVATGQPHGVTVWGDSLAGEEYGYRLYRKSHRKVFVEE